MQKSTAMFAVFLTGSWMCVSACGKAGKKQRTENRSGRAGIGTQKTVSGRGSPNGQTVPTGSGQGEVVDGTGPQVQVVSVGRPIQDKSYSLTLTGPAVATKGKPAVFELTLVPKNPYHTNKLFPFKLSFDRVPENVKLGKTVYEKKDAALFSPQKAIFKLVVTPTGPLPVKVSGLYKFSVCTPKFCETPKAKVELTLGGTAGSEARTAPTRQSSGGKVTKTSKVAARSR